LGPYTAPLLSLVVIRSTFSFSGRARAWSPSCVPTTSVQPGRMAGLLLLNSPAQSECSPNRQSRPETNSSHAIFCVRCEMGPATI
jgi:hypothetical protein